MTTQEKFDILNAYYGVILENKSFLTSTDYKTIREAEGGEPMDDKTKTARAESREVINQYQEWVKEIEAIVPEDPEPPGYKTPDPENPDPETPQPEA